MKNHIHSENFQNFINKDELVSSPINIPCTKKGLKFVTSFVELAIEEN